MKKLQDEMMQNYQALTEDEKEIIRANQDTPYSQPAARARQSRRSFRRAPQPQESARSGTRWRLVQQRPGRQPATRIDLMPKVRGKKYPYTKKGKEAAKKARKKKTRYA